MYTINYNGWYYQYTSRQCGTKSEKGAMVYLALKISLNTRKEIIDDGLTISTVANPRLAGRHE
jgi:hypothetical protein